MSFSHVDLVGRRHTAIVDADWQPMYVGETRLPGVSVCNLVDVPEHWSSYWMKMEAGAHSIMHRHSAIEMVVVLQGSIEDCDRRIFQTTEAVVYPAGSIHLLSSPTGCVLLIVESQPSVVA
ncbi:MULTISPECIES: cupin domain-containing protein [Pseudomonas]|uniref:cupin domain-containing protein n=1 Tax=Pseudomonas TaxID=286 RepID=UPI0009E507AA|nr:MULTISPECIES: cupin domain-containing protein [Pseudomonas]